mmetsp:Transcript_26042/g.61207  ORF Transcript_26042/g.61207 Transcript_26042/m.61207 type:complete len:113 (+) Transcript_26042:238-576(+)
MTDSAARAVTLAGRSENDPQSPVSERYCSVLLKKHVPADFEFPTECRKFDSFRAGLVRRDSKQREEAVAFAGMDPGAAVKAMTAREQGHPSEAQLIRRMSSRRNNSKETSWF